MQPTEFNSLAFIMQGGFVSIAVAVILLVMSVASWYFMLVKTVQVLKIKKLNQAIYGRILGSAKSTYRHQ